MFGQNTIVKQQKKSDYDGTIGITEIFYTLQGEGMFSGRPALFIRVKDCCLSCHFCDTEFSKGSNMSVDSIILEAREQIKNVKCDLIVITGGEPLIHQGVSELANKLLSLGFKVQIETCGAVFLDTLPLDNPSFYIVVSPKTGKINKSIYENADAFKYIITAGEVNPNTGLPNMSTQIKGSSLTIAKPRPGANVYLTPCDPHLEEEDYKANTDAAIVSCMKHGYTLNLQVHKIVGLP